MIKALKTLDLDGLNNLDKVLYEQFELLDNALKDTSFLYSHNSRELALFRTKLQEARFWLLEAILKEVAEKEKRK